MGKRSTHKDIHLKNALKNTTNTQVIKEACSQKAPDWFALTGEVIYCRRVNALGDKMIQKFMDTLKAAVP